MNIQKLLSDYKNGKLQLRHLVKMLKELPYSDLGDVKLDNHRRLRKSFSEVIYCENKTPEQINKILSLMLKHKSNILLTRVKDGVYEKLSTGHDSMHYNSVARTISVFQENNKPKGKVLVISAGTSDAPVAEEAAETLKVMGVCAEKLYDCGVAGIHRLLANRQKLDKADCLIVIAGMDGVLPSVVSGLTSKPVIAVPTSIGYGASFKGIGPLLTMLNSCSPGIAVVNIDNGFGAGYMAALIAGRGNVSKR